MLFQEGKLELNGAVKVVQKITPALKDGRFILILRKLVVDVLVFDGLGIERVRDAADTVRPHAFIGDTGLGRLLFFISPVRPCDGGLDLFSLGAGQFASWG